MWDAHVAITILRCSNSFIIREILIQIKTTEDFLGGPVVKNPPAGAEIMGLILGPGRCHMSRST